MIRKSFWAVILLGVVFIVSPFALRLPSRAGAGQDMMDGFRPIMQPAAVNQAGQYYTDVFAPLAEVVPALNAETIAKFNTYVEGFTAMGVEAQNLVPKLAQAMGMTPAQVQTFMVAQFPAMSQLLQNLPTIQKDFTDLVGLMQSNVATFAQVPGALEFFQPMITTMQANVDNYAKADALPNMRLFTWFFVVPGALLVGIGAVGLAASRKSGGWEHAPVAPLSTKPLARERELVSH